MTYQPDLELINYQPLTIEDIELVERLLNDADRKREEPTDVEKYYTGIRLNTRFYERFIVCDINS